MHKSELYVLWRTTLLNRIDANQIFEDANASYFFQGALTYTLQKYVEQFIKILMLLKQIALYSTCHGAIKCQ